MSEYRIRNVRLRGSDDDGLWNEWEYDFYKDGKKNNQWFFDTVGSPTLYDLRNALLLLKNTDLSFHCLDCGVHTGELGEYYTVEDEVWLYANPDDSGMLCVGCLEKRIGRELVPADFPDYPVNDLFGSKSPRLRSRISGEQTEVAVS